MHDDDKKKELGQAELEVLKDMFERWIKSDVVWAANIIATKGSTGEDDEWDFLRRDWIEKLEVWMAPYLIRLYRTGYITEDELRKFGEEATHTIKTMLEALYALGGSLGNE